ncbi:hypothetical protein J6TS7_12090 [Paenibacillus dendritiformis]|nr:hypothetical protein J6TS7_12090 [Paenibacillus dendritiformis]
MNVGHARKAAADWVMRHASREEGFMGHYGRAPGHRGELALCCLPVSIRSNGKILRTEKVNNCI